MRFIQVGIGGWGETWLPPLQRHRTAKLVGLVDRTADVLEKARQQTGLSTDQCFTDYREAFDKVQADAVLCVLPASLGHQAGLCAVEHGLHVLTEKPLADTMTHARALVSAASHADRTLMVSQNYRFRPWARNMRHMVCGGQFGALDNMAVRFARSLRPKGVDRVTGHPFVREIGTHHFDLMRAITGRNPVRVYSRMWQPGWSWFDTDASACAIFEFAGSITALYEGTCVTRGHETTWDGQWRVECREAVIELRGGDVVIIKSERPDEQTQVEFQRVPVSGQTAVLDEFVSAIADKREPECSGRDNMVTLAMGLAVEESSRTGRPVDLISILDGP